jgi:hypothetical protein
VLVALLLWCAVGMGVAHASGRLAWVDRYPWAARILEGFAPRLAMGLPTAAAATTSAPAPAQPGETRERPPPPTPPVGQTGFRHEISPPAILRFFNMTLRWGQKYSRRRVRSGSYLAPLDRPPACVATEGPERRCFDRRCPRELG